MKVRSVPISNVLLAEIKDWFAFREEMAKKKPHVEESPYIFYSQQSPKFAVRGIQTMKEGYSLSNKKLTPHMFRHNFCKWMLKATNKIILRTGVEIGEVDEVIIGQAKQSADSSNLARLALLRAGLPVQVPGYTVHRQCGSGVQSIIMQPYKS